MEAEVISYLEHFRVDLEGGLCLRISTGFFPFGFTMSTRSITKVFINAHISSSWKYVKKRLTFNIQWVVAGKRVRFILMKQPTWCEQLRGDTCIRRRGANSTLVTLYLIAFHYRIHNKDSCLVENFDPRRRIMKIRFVAFQNYQLTKKLLYYLYPDNNL